MTGWAATKGPGNSRVRDGLRVVLGSLRQVFPLSFCLFETQIRILLCIPNGQCIQAVESCGVCCKGRRCNFNLNTNGALSSSATQLKSDVGFKVPALIALARGQPYISFPHSFPLHGKTIPCSLPVFCLIKIHPPPLSLFAMKTLPCRMPCLE